MAMLPLTVLLGGALAVAAAVAVVVMLVTRR